MNKKNQNVYIRLLSYLLKYKIRVFFSIVCILIGVLSMALAPFFVGYAINDIGEIFKNGLTDKLKEGFILYVVLGGCCYVMASIMISLSQNILASATQTTMYNLRKQINEKLHKLPLNYYDTTTYGDIRSRLTNDVNIISDSLCVNIFTIVNAIFTVIIVVTMMLKISGVLTAIALLSIPILVIISNKITSKSQKAYTNQAKLTGDLNGYLGEY
ncbi:MAG: hypothetical protein MJ151_03655, partial [Lachnospiraceae bacterium]|nr:hypothetical protein [Lachnospiraceae bacterium]